MKSLRECLRVLFIFNRIQRRRVFMCVLIVAFVDCISLGTAAWASDGVMFNEIPNLPPYLKYVYPEGWGNIKWGDAPEKLGDDRIFLDSYKTSNENIRMYVYKKRNELKTFDDFEIDEVFYTFANSKLYKTVISFKKHMNFFDIKKKLVAQYGDRLTKETDSVCGWHDLLTNFSLSLVKNEGQNPIIMLMSGITIISVIDSTK